MKRVGALVLGVLAVSFLAASSESPTSLAQEHVRKACEAVWANTAPLQIQRCTERAMAALGEEDRLRDRELKRMLIDAETDLETCEVDRAALRNELATSRARRAGGTSKSPTRK